MPYNNLTLSSSTGDLAITVYLPNGVDAGSDSPNNLYYYSSRFEHGSMIGNIQIRRPTPTKSSTGEEEEESSDKDKESQPPYQYHTLYGTNLWRIPHNSNWPESGVGLASEFGVGDEGDFCYYRCGWPEASDITNGVLGYKEARSGNAFLKVGVGALIKGTCPACDSTEDYKFNSPYLFAAPPEWKLTKLSKTPSRIYGVKMEHQAVLRAEHGYKLQKEMMLVADNVLEVTTTLTNLGNKPFSTVWYSHNFFSCDDNAVGPGYAVDMDLTMNKELEKDFNYIDQLYNEPGTWSWSTPLLAYGRIVAANVASLLWRVGIDPYNPDNLQQNIRVEMDRTLDPGIRIKSEFVPQASSQGAFVLEACQTRIQNTFRMNTNGADDKFNMYAYNLYLERGTFSPEPQMLFHFEAGETKSWTQRLEFDAWIDDDEEDGDSDSGGASWFMSEMAAYLRRPAPLEQQQEQVPSSRQISSASSSSVYWMALLLCCCTVTMVVAKLTASSSQTQRARRLEYTRIENVEEAEGEGSDAEDDDNGRRQGCYQNQPQKRPES